MTDSAPRVRKTVYALPLQHCVTNPHGYEYPRLQSPYGFALIISSMLLRLRSAEELVKLSSLQGGNSTVATTRDLSASPAFSRCSSAHDCDITQLADGLQRGFQFTNGSLRFELGALNAHASEAINERVGHFFEFEQEVLPAPLFEGYAKSPANFVLKVAPSLRKLNALLEQHGLVACDVSDNNLRFDVHGRLKLFDANLHDESEFSGARHFNDSRSDMPPLNLKFPLPDQISKLESVSRLQPFYQALLRIAKQPPFAVDPFAHVCRMRSAEFPRLRTHMWSRWPMLLTVYQSSIHSRDGVG